MNDQFGDTAATFDLDAWIDQAARPRREVTIYSRWDLLEEYDRLVAQLPTESLGDANMAGESLADDGDEDIRAQIDEVLAQLEASGHTFTIQALNQTEIKEITEAAPTTIVDLGDGKTREKTDPIAAGEAMLAAAILAPPTTAEQLRRLRMRLGDGPVQPLFTAATELRSVGQVLPTVPSSREH